MDLSVKERISLLSILPQQGDIITIRICHDLRMMLALQDSEEEKAGITKKELGGGQMTIEVRNDYETELSFSHKQIQLIIEALEGMDKNKSLTIGHLSLWDKFCNG